MDNTQHEAGDVVISAETDFGRVGFPGSAVIGRKRGEITAGRLIPITDQILDEQQPLIRLEVLRMITLN